MFSLSFNSTLPLVFLFYLFYFIRLEELRGNEGFAMRMENFAFFPFFELVGFAFSGIVVI